eukprot:gene30603-36977_t
MPSPYGSVKFGSSGKYAYSPRSIRRLSIRLSSSLNEKELPTEVQMAIKIQRCYRGYCGRKAYQSQSLFIYRKRYQAQFATYEGLTRFKFQQTGAALLIQRWFRSRNYWLKMKWHERYRKMVEKYKRQKILFGAICKSHIPFKQVDLDDVHQCKHASSIVVQKIIRGFLGRRRVRRLIAQIHNTAILHAKSATCMQSVARMFLAQCRWYPLGLRYRLYVRKVKKYGYTVAIKAFVYGESGDGEGNTDRKLVVPTGVYTPPVESIDHATLPLGANTYTYPEDFLPYAGSRRHTHIYATLQICGVEHLDAMQVASVHVQRHIRGLLGRARYKKVLLAHKQVLATRLQRWIMKWVWNRKASRARGVLSPFFGGIVSKRRAAQRAALVLTRYVRRYSKHNKITKILRLKNFSAGRIGRWCRRRLRIRHNCRQFNRKRVYAELVSAGAKCFSITEVYWYTKYLWQGIRMTKQVEKQEHELQRIFLPMSLSNAVEFSKLIKMLRDCEGLFTAQFTANSLEIQFSKLKAGQERRMDYTRFLDLLAHLATIRFLNFDPPKTLFEELAVFQQQKLSTAVLDPSMQKVVQFRYGSLSGRAALISKFVSSFISTLPEYAKVLEHLGPKAAQEQANTTIGSAVRVLHIFVKNRLFITQTRRDIVNYKKAKLREKEVAAVKKIQRVARGYLGRRFIQKMAQHLYSKYVDGETETEYWFNPRTQTSYWTKPRLLGELDCGPAVRMPTPDETFTIFCTNCEKNHATCYCQQCNGPYCTPCYASIHRTGTRKAHQHLLVDNCVQCEFQVAAVLCQTCGDLFCDSCFNHMHKSGRLRYHAFERYATRCDSCQKRSARWREHGQMRLTAEELLSSSAISRKISQRFSRKASIRGSLLASANIRYKVRHWCTVCYKREFQEEPKVREAVESVDDAPPITALSSMPYYGREVKRHLEEQEIKKAQDVIEKNFQQRKLEVEKKRQDKAVRLIQRVYRGYRVRQMTKEFIRQRKELMRLRQEENAIRDSLLYKLRNSLGWRVKLQSDTPLERVNALYPWYMKHIVAEAIENNWTDACRLLVLHEEYLAKHQVKSGQFQKWKNRLLVFLADSGYKGAEKRYREKKKEYESALTVFYNAEASGAYSAPKLKQLKQQCNQLEKQLKKTEKKKQSALSILTTRQTALYRIEGPRYLQNCIRSRLKDGLPLPFQVYMRFGCRYAQVIYDEDDGEMNQPDDVGLEFPGAADGEYAPLPDAEEGISGGAVRTHRTGRSWGISTRMTGESWSADRGPDDEEQVPQLPRSSPLPRTPGAWKARLKAGDRMFVGGVLFTVLPSIVASKPKTPKSGSRGSSRNKGGDSSRGSGDAGDGTAAAGNDTSRSGQDTSRSATRDSANTKNTRDVRGDVLPPDFDLNPQDYIPMDRPWLFDDGLLSPHKQLPQVFYLRPALQLRRAVLRSFP